MKVLITIPETEYKRYKFKSFETITFAEDAIANGIVIQEGESAEDNITRAPFTSELERYEKIEQIINEYKRQLSGNVFTNDKYFRRILEVFEVD